MGFDILMGTTTSYLNLYNRNKNLIADYFYLSTSSFVCGTLQKKTVNNQKDTNDEIFWYYYNESKQ